MPLNVGQVLEGRYRIDTMLGQGGMGAVYGATDLRFGTPVAVKENLEVTVEAQRQFSREAALLHQMRHPNLPHVSDYFSIPGQGQYLIMDYVQGEDLGHLLKRVGRVPEGQALAWTGQVLNALEYLHSRNVIHRDVKPANVKITPEGQVFLVDFGLAKVHDPKMQTTIGARGVTPGYAPPEQYGQGRTDVRTDIYSAGATLYALLTGQAPPDALERVTRQALLVPPHEVNPAVSKPVGRAVVRALEMPPADRFQTIAEFRSALCQAPEATARPGPSPAVAVAAAATQTPSRAHAQAVREAPSRAGQLPRAKRPDWLWPAALGVAAALVVLTIVLLAWRFGRRESRLPSAPTSAAASPRPVEATQGPISTAGAGEQLVADIAFVFTTDRDGKREVYALAGGKAVRLTLTPGRFESWSPVIERADSILFTSSRDGKREVYRMTKAGVNRLTDTPGSGESWSATPTDSGDVLFTSNRDGKREIYRLSKSTGQVVRVTNTPNGESWSPAAQPAGDIYFTSDRSGKWEIYRLSSSTGEAIQVTNTFADRRSWSPAPTLGGDLWFVSDRDGKPEIYRMSGGQAIRTSNTPGSGTSWSPTLGVGGVVLFVSDRDGKPEVYSPSGGRAVRYTNTPGQSGSWLVCRSATCPEDE